MRKYRNTIFALALAVGLTAFFTWLLSFIFSSFEWASLGIALISFGVVVDLFIRFVPNSFSYEPIFTNVRDTVVIITGLLIASATAYIPEWTKNEGLWQQVIAHLFAVVVGYTIFFLLGSDRLKRQLRKKG